MAVKTKTVDLIKSYYDAFNSKDMTLFFSLLSDDVIHDINQGPVEVGKNAFMNFMHKMNTCYEEQVENLHIMVSEDDAYAAARFDVRGKYLKSDGTLPKAKGQTYFIRVNGFFEIANGKITRVTTYYNLTDWIRQVSV